MHLFLTMICPALDIPLRLPLGARCSSLIKYTMACLANIQAGRGSDRLLLMPLENVFEVYYCTADNIFTMVQ